MIFSNNFLAVEERIKDRDDEHCEPVASVNPTAYIS